MLRLILPPLIEMTLIQTSWPRFTNSLGLLTLHHGLQVSFAHRCGRAAVTDQKAAMDEDDTNAAGAPSAQQKQAHAKSAWVCSTSTTMKKQMPSMPAILLPRTTHRLFQQIRNEQHDLYDAGPQGWYSRGLGKGSTEVPLSPGLGEILHVHQAFHLAGKPMELHKDAKVSDCGH